MMSDPREVADLSSSVPPASPCPRRPARRTHRPTVAAETPSELLEHPTPAVRRRSTRRPRNVRQASRETNTSTEELARERSPLNRGIGPCPICLEQFSTQPLLSTSCGHVFCERCLQLSLCRYKKCPICRKTLRGRNAYHPVFL